MWVSGVIFRKSTRFIECSDGCDKLKLVYCYKTISLTIFVSTYVLKSKCEYSLKRLAFHIYGLKSRSLTGVKRAIILFRNNKWFIQFKLQLFLPGEYVYNSLFKIRFASKHWNCIHSYAGSVGKSNKRLSEAIFEASFDGSKLFLVIYTVRNYDMFRLT